MNAFGTPGENNRGLPYALRSRRRYQILISVLESRESVPNTLGNWENFSAFPLTTFVFRNVVNSRKLRHISHTLLENRGNSLCTNERKKRVRPGQSSDKPDVKVLFTGQKTARVALQQGPDVTRSDVQCSSRTKRSHSLLWPFDLLVLIRLCAYLSAAECSCRCSDQTRSQQH